MGGEVSTVKATLAELELRVRDKKDKKGTYHAMTYA